MLVVTAAALAAAILPAGANFGGYSRDLSGHGGMALNLDKTNHIRLVKERLSFDLGQRVDFVGQFWFENGSGESKTVMLAFPQRSLWTSKLIDGKYAAQGFKHLKATILIDGKEQRPDEFYSRVLDNPGGANSEPIKLLTSPEMERVVAEHAGDTEADVGDTGMPFLIWNVLPMECPPRGRRLVEVRFKRAWSYQDEFWSERRSGGPRFFDYITWTAATWEGGTVDDFEARVSFPPEAEDHLALRPAGWRKMGPGAFVFKRAHRWQPKDDLRFEWKHDNELDSSGDFPYQNFQGQGATDFYYKDYSWRFLFDGSPRTAWCVPNENFSASKGFVVKWSSAARIELATGYGASEALFHANGRPDEIELSFCGKSTFESHFKNPCGAETHTLKLRDTMKSQIFDLQPAPAGTKFLKFRIKSYVKGGQSSDICLSELRLR